VGEQRHHPRPRGAARPASRRCCRIPETQAKDLVVGLPPRWTRATASCAAGWCASTLRCRTGAWPST
jgi:hypothetical protein